jgi:putative ribosome biogenesis GTPase RsgA
LDVDEELLENKISSQKYDKYLKMKEKLNEKQKEFQTKILIEIN